MIHRVEFRALFWQEDQFNAEGARQGLALGRNVTGRFIQQEPDWSSLVGTPQAPQESLERLLSHVGSAPHYPMPSMQVDRPKQDSFRIPPRDKDFGLLATQRPCAPQQREQAEDGFIFKEQDGPGR